MAMPEATITSDSRMKKAGAGRRLLVLLTCWLRHRLHVRGGGAFLALRHVEGDLLAFLERLEARRLDRAVVAEEILAAVIRRNESEALRVVEPLHGTCSHCLFH